MKLKDFIKKYILKDKEVLAEEITEQVYQTVKESETPEEAAKEGAKTAFELYKEWTRKIKPEERGEFVEQLAKELTEKKGVPYEIATDFINKMIDDEEVSNKYIMDPAKVLPSEKISKIVDNDNISLEHKQELVKAMENEDIRKKAEEKIKKEKEEKEKKRKEEKERKEKELKKELKKKYTTCDKVQIINLIAELEIVKEKSKSTEVNNMIKQILARRSASECSEVGNTRISEMTRIISAEEMLGGDFLQLVKGEFEEIKRRESDNKEKKYKYKDIEKYLKQQILSEIAKKVVQTYKKVGIIDIPQSENMKKLTEEEEDFFIKQIQIYGEEIEDIEKLKKQIKGEVRDYREDLKEMIEKIPEDEIETYTNIIQILMKRKQKKLKLNLEEQIGEIREELQGLNEEDAIEILEEITIEIQEKKNEKEKIKQITEEKTQSDDDEYTR